ncbi:MAG TPA: hypothetical protein VN936_12040 [Candidatus Acidoferrum sp.]|nr:hypothetical protein [Candidatus Acidoferrum sp.]
MRRFTIFSVAAMLVIALNACDGGYRQQLPQIAGPSSQNATKNGGALLYLGQPYQNKISIFPYAHGVAGSAIATINILSENGICSDNNGNVYVPTGSDRNISVFEHGATSPTRTIRVSGYPLACAVDRSTGTLAVTVFTRFGKLTKDCLVYVYPHAQAPGKKYLSFKSFANAESIAYDNLHDLFVVSNTCGRHHQCSPYELYELTPGADAFRQVYLKGLTFARPVEIAWTNRGLLLASSGTLQSRSTGFTLSIRNYVASVLNTIPFANSRTVNNIAVDDGLAIVTNDTANAVDTYRVRTGKPISILSGGLGEPFGITISR